MDRAQAKRSVAFEVLRSRKSELKVVRTPAFLFCAVQQPGPGVFPHQVVAYGLEDVETVDRTDVVLQSPFVEGLARRRRDTLGDHLVSESGVIVDSHEVDLR